VDREIESADHVKLEPRCEHEDQHRDAVRGGKGERAVGREEHHPRNEGADDREGHSNPDAAEQAGQQDRRQERHRAEAFAHSAEEPAQDGGQPEECGARRQPQQRPVARQLSKQR